MKLKQYIRYEMDFQCGWAMCCGGFIGLSFFLRALYYFYFVNLQDVGGAEQFFCLILPLLLCFVFVLLFRILKWNAPGIFAILGSCFCLLLMFWNFSSGDFLRALLSVILYIAASVILLGTAGGYLPSRLPAAAVFAGMLLLRFMLYSGKESGIAAWVLELSALSVLVSLLALCLCLKPRVKRNEG